MANGRVGGWKGRRVEGCLVSPFQGWDFSMRKTQGCTRQVGLTLGYDVLPFQGIFCEDE